MKTYTIENETSNITLHATSQEAAGVADSEQFRDEAELAELAAIWPSVRLVKIWNAIPGTVAVKRFTDRKTAVTRIWKAIQNLGDSIATPIGSEAPRQTPPAELVAAPDAATGTPVLLSDVWEAIAEAIADRAEPPALATLAAPQTPHVASDKALPGNKATRAKKTPKPAPEKKTRDRSKTETILTMIRQPGGTTLQAIMAATGWQAHSVRGFISGTLGTKMGLTVMSVKGQDGERAYSIPR